MHKCPNLVHIALFTSKGETYTRQSDTAVTALGRGSKLFQVVVDKLTTWCLHNPSAVGGGVIGSSLAEGDTLGHWYYGS